MYEDVIRTVNNKMQIKFVLVGGDSLIFLSLIVSYKINLKAILRFQMSLKLASTSGLSNNIL